MASTDNGSDVSETSVSNHKPSKGGDHDEENACTCVVVPDRWCVACDSYSLVILEDFSSSHSITDHGRISFKCQIKDGQEPRFVKVRVKSDEKDFRLSERLVECVGPNILYITVTVKNAKRFAQRLQSAKGEVFKDVQFECQLALILVPELWIPHRMVASQATFRNIFTTSEISIKPGDVQTVDLNVRLPGTMRLINHPVAIRMAASDCFTPFSFGELALLTRFGTIGPSHSIKVDVKNCDNKYGHIDKDTKFGSVVSLVDDAYSRPLLPKCHINEALPPRDYVLVAVDARWMEWSDPAAASQSSPIRQELMSIGAADFVSCGKGDISDCFFQAALPADVVNMIEGGNVVAKEGNALKKLGIKTSRDKGRPDQERLMYGEPNGYSCPLRTEAEVLQNLLSWMQQSFDGHKVILVTYDWTKEFEVLFRDRLSKHNLLGQFKKVVKGRVTLTTGLSKMPPNLEELTLSGRRRRGGKRKWKEEVPALLEASQSLATCVFKSLGTRPNYVNFVSVYALHDIFIFNRKKPEVASTGATLQPFDQMDLTIKTNSKPCDSQTLSLQRIR